MLRSMVDDVGECCRLALVTVLLSTARHDVAGACVFATIGSFPEFDGQPFFGIVRDWYMSSKNSVKQEYRCSEKRALHRG